VQDFLNLEFLGFWGGGNKQPALPFFKKENVAKVLKFEKRKSFDKSKKSC
jgi:hypothetical protein